MNRLIRNLVTKAKLARYHQKHRKQVLRALNQLEKTFGPVSKQSKNSIDTYAREVFGSKVYAPWLYAYYCTRRSVEGFVPDNYFGAVLVPKLAGNTKYISGTQTLHTRLFSGNFFPDIASSMNGLYLDTKLQIIPENRLLDVLFDHGETIVFKRSNSLRGLGIHFLEHNTSRFEDVKKLGNGVFQRLINQHAFFKQFTTTSVATIRMTSFLRRNGYVKLLAAFLRLGGEGDTHITGSSSMQVSIDVITGELQDFGLLPDWSVTATHPESGIAFANLAIPSWDKFISTATKLHKQVPFTRCIGWDMVLNDNGDVEVMEWNAGHTDIKFSEITTGPIFGDIDFDEELN